MTAEEGSIRVLDDKRTLIGRLEDENGEYQDASIDLDQFLGNNNGSFQWDGVSFSETAEGVHFDIEGESNVPVLRAQLRNGEGDYVDANVNLAERIRNGNGQFQFE